MIAGSPRNASRGSLRGSVEEVEHWLGEEERFSSKSSQTPNASTSHPGSEAVRDKLHGREGNNPDHRLRPLSTGLVGKEVGLLRQPGCWLRSSHHLKSA